MQLSQALWFKLHNCSSDSLGNREIGRVNLAEHTTISGNRLRLMLVCMVDIRAVALEISLGCLFQILTDGAIENVWELGRHLVKDRGTDAKVLCKNVLRCVGNPVVDHEGCSVRLDKVLYDGWEDIPDLFKVAIVEDKEIFILLFQSLNVMSDALGKVPDITRVELLGSEATVLVNASKKKRAVVDESPFSLHH